METNSDPSSLLFCNENLEANPEHSAYTELLEAACGTNRKFVLFTKMNGNKEIPRIRTALGQDDIKLINDLGQLSADKLMDYIRNLQNAAKILADEEDRQFSRGKCLKILRS